MNASVFDISQIVIIGCFAFVGDVFALPGILVLFIPLVGIPIAFFLFFLSGFLSLVTSSLLFVKLRNTLPEIKRMAQSPAAALDPIGSAITLAPWLILGLGFFLGIFLPVKLLAAMLTIALTNSGVKKALNLAANVALAVGTGGGSAVVEGVEIAATAGRVAEQTAVRSAERAAVQTAERAAVREGIETTESAARAETARLPQAEEPKMPQEKPESASKTRQSNQNFSSGDEDQEGEGGDEDEGGDS